LKIHKFPPPVEKHLNALTADLYSPFSVPSSPHQENKPDTGFIPSQTILVNRENGRVSTAGEFIWIPGRIGIIYPNKGMSPFLFSGLCKAHFQCQRLHETRRDPFTECVYCPYLLEVIMKKNEETQWNFQKFS